MEAPTPPAPALQVSVAAAAVDESKNNVTPPPPPMTLPPLLVIALLPAVDVSQNAVLPPTDCVTELPLLIKVAWSAVELLWNCTTAPVPPLCAGAAVVTVAVPAFALFENVSVPWSPFPSTPTTRFWDVAELLIMPTPLMVNANKLSVIVNALAPELNTMLFNCIRLERDTPVMLDLANVAVSVAELGTVAGAQLAAVLQSPVAGAAFHVALPAKLVLPDQHK